MSPWPSTSRRLQTAPEARSLVAAFACLLLAAACDSGDPSAADGGSTSTCDASSCCVAADVPVLDTNGRVPFELRDIIMVPDVGPGVWFGTWVGVSEAHAITDMSIQTMDLGEVHFSLPAADAPVLDPGEEVSVSLMRSADPLERDDRLIVTRLSTREVVAAYVTQTLGALSVSEWNSLSAPVLTVHSYPACRSAEQGACGFHTQTYDLIFAAGAFQIEIGQGESAVLDAGGSRFLVMNRQTLDNGITSPTDVCAASGVRSFDIVSVPNRR